MKDNKGFSLIELLVAFTVFVVMTAMVTLAILSANTTYHSADARIVTQEDLRKALRTMIHEISETNQFRIDTSVAGRIVFQVPIRVISGGPFQGETVDDRNNVIFGARLLPTTNPDGYEAYAIRYLLQPNNDISNSNSLIRQVLDSFPNGNQVGNDLIIANYINTLSFVRSGQTLTINVSTVKQSKFGRNEQVTGNFGITMRN